MKSSPANLVFTAIYEWDDRLADRHSSLVYSIIQFQDVLWIDLGICLSSSSFSPQAPKPEKGRHIRTTEQKQFYNIFHSWTQSNKELFCGDL